MPHQRFYSLHLTLAVLLLAGAGAIGAQSAKSQPATKSAAEVTPEGGEPRYIRPETPEERRERLQTEVDPGKNPDPETIFRRNGAPYRITRYEKEHAAYVAKPGWVRPLANVNFQREIYQENDKYVWVWQEVREKAEEAEDPPVETRGTYRKYSEEDVAYFAKLRPEFSPLNAADAGVRLQFEESSAGLPTSGSWRNGAAVADINRDGRVDLILPPQRGAGGPPSIFLGSANNEWKRWDIQWPRAFNYGTVVAADFNRDKHLDLAFAVHLSGVAVFLHDGKGGFTEVVEGLPKQFPTRRIVAADVDQDGWTDIVALSEGPVGRGEDRAARASGTLRALLNRNKGQSWEAQRIAEPREYLGGDFLTALDFNGDPYPDFIGANVYFNATHTLFTSSGKGEWDSFGATGLNIPGRSYYHANTAGPLRRGAKTEDAFLAFSRVWPGNLDPASVPLPPTDRVTGIDRISWNDGKPQRTSVIRWEGFRGIRGLASADFNGDGNLDLMYADERQRKMELLLGDGKGSFSRGEVIGLPVLAQRLYDLKVADLNGDGRQDVLIMYESDERTAFEQKNGSVRVYLNRGAVAAPVEAK